MAETKIINDGATIKVTLGTFIRSIPKASIHYLDLSNTGDLIISHKGGSTVIKFSTVPDPITANPESLRVKVESMLDIGVSFPIPKLQRIKDSLDYNREITYSGTTSNVLSIIHSGTTPEGEEQITETLSYADIEAGDFRV